MGVVIDVIPRHGSPSPPAQTVGAKIRRPRLLAMTVEAAIGYVDPSSRELLRSIGHQPGGRPNRRQLLAGHDGQCEPPGHPCREDAGHERDEALHASRAPMGISPTNAGVARTGPRRIATSEK